MPTSSLPDATQVRRFRAQVLAWFDREGRKDLPWQLNKTAYGVWLSEIMLQQTQVATVRGYFARFTGRFSDVQALAAAPLDAVLGLWAGLGYYARARNLHKTAQAVVTEHGGVFPRDLDALVALPGIGRSTAGAIASSAYGERAAILDGNVRRVLSRVFAISQSESPRRAEQQRWALSEVLTPAARVADYNQAMMDLGATVCLPRRPECPRCPLRGSCLALKEQAIGRYPGPKPRKILPVRQARVLWLESEAGVLLSQRETRGLWGGLWWLPEVPEILSPGEAAEALDLPVTAMRALPVLRHTFSHFHLDIQAWQLRVRGMKAGRASRIMPAPLRWHADAALDHLGVPAPLLRLRALAQTPAADADHLPTAKESS